MTPSSLHPAQAHQVCRASPSTNWIACRKALYTATHLISKRLCGAEAQDDRVRREARQDQSSSPARDGKGIISSTKLSTVTARGRHICRTGHGIPSSASKDPRFQQQDDRCDSVCTCKSRSGGRRPPRHRHLTLPPPPSDHSASSSPSPGRKHQPSPTNRHKQTHEVK